jgi:phosphoadenosine phosphosulfate reductase
MNSIRHYRASLLWGGDRDLSILSNFYFGLHSMAIKISNNVSQLDQQESPITTTESAGLPLLGYEARYCEQFHALDVVGRISRVLLDFPETTIATTSGGIQSGFLLAHLAHVRLTASDEVRSAAQKLPIIVIDTGDLFRETLSYLAQLKQQLGLNILRYRHNLSEEEVQVNLVALQKAGLTPQSAFDELTKVRPMRAILSQYQARVWIAGNRRDQSSSRADLPYAAIQNDTLKVYPIADIRGESIADSLRGLGIPLHPLFGCYRSVGNRSDTQHSDGPYEKSGRHGGLKEECGLHEAWVQRGKTLVLSKNGFVPCEQVPIVRADLRGD